MKIKDFIKRHKALTALIIIILIGAGYFYYRSSSTSQAATRYIIGTVSKGTLISSVSGSGQVAVVNQLDIKPQSSGTVVLVSVKQGQDVKTGQIIAILDSKSALNAINQAKVSLESAQANYDKIISGATTADLAVSQASVDSAQLNLTNAQNNLENVKAQQQTAVNNAIRNLLNSNLVAVPSPTNSSIVIPTISGTYIGNQQGQYVINFVASPTGNSADTGFSFSGLEAGSNYLGQNPAAVSVPLGSNGLYIQFSNASAIGSADSWTISIPNVKGSNYLSNYNAYQTVLQNQTQALTNAQNQIASAQISLNQAKASMALKQEPPTQADVDAAKVQIDNAEIQLQTAQDNYVNTIIRAPFDGQIATISVQKGDQASSASAVAILVTKQELAQVSLNETDTSQVKIGQQATLTFDAVEGLNLTGKVIQIDTLGTISQGVVSYSTQISLDTQDERIKPGMSVTANIIVSSKQDVLLVPNSALKTQSGQSYVAMVEPTAIQSTAASISQVLLKTPPQNQTVETGLSNDSYTEIVNGLNEGDKIVTQTISANTTSSSNSSSGSSSLRIPGLTGGAAGGGTFRGN